MSNQYSESKIDEDGVEYYAPDLGNAKPLQIHDNEEDVEDFETRLDQKVIFQRVAKELYKYPSSAIRELLVNAIGHGARKANEKYGDSNNACVEIHLHPHERHLTITDIRGMGMTFAQIKSLMSYVGKSGNMDSKTAGQFGMGYFSHLKVADSCIVETKVRDAYEYKGEQVKCMAFLNNRGWQWQKINKSDDDVELEEPGTRISLTLNNDIDIYDVIDTIKKVSEYQDIPVELILDDDYGKMSAGKIEIEQNADLSKVHEDVEGQETIILDDEDVYFKAVMYKGDYGNLAHNGAKVITLARVPIDVDDGMIPNFSGYILNIKNERKYMPLPDRERLAVKSEEALKVKLEKLFKDHFGKLTATTAEELEAMPYQMPVLFMKQLGIARFFTQATKDFINSVVDHTITHIIYDNERHITEYGAPHNMHQVLSYRKNALVVNNKALPPIRAVHEYFAANGLGKPKFIRIDKKTSVVAKTLINEWNIPYIRDFMKENKIKSSKSNNSTSTGLTFHHRRHYGRDTEKITDFDDIDYQKTIWIKGPLKPWMECIGQQRSQFYVTKWNRKAVEYGIENEEPILTEATLYGLSDFEVITSKGKQMFSEWVKETNKIQKWSRYNDIDIIVDDENDLENNNEQSLYTLNQMNDNYASYDEEPKYVNSAMIISQETIALHDIEGNEVECSFNENINFIVNAYERIRNDFEIRDSISSQLKDGYVQVPYKPTKLKKYNNCNDVYEQSWAYKNSSSIRGFSENIRHLRKTDSWRSYELGIEDYYGVENSFHLRYSWEEKFDLLLKIKDGIAKSYESTDMRNLILHAIMESNSTDFELSVRQQPGKSPTQTDVDKFFVKLRTIIDEPKTDNNLDLFFSTRKTLNNLDDINDALKGADISSSCHNVARELHQIFVKLNRRVQITGNYERFLNEFVNNSQATVIEDEKTPSIVVSCNASAFNQVRSLIELHSPYYITEIIPEGEKRLQITFIPAPTINGITFEQSSRYSLVTKKCPCGCENHVSEKLIKYNEDY